MWIPTAATNQKGHHCMGKWCSMLERMEADRAADVASWQPTWAIFHHSETQEFKTLCFRDISQELTKYKVYSAR
jgi:hypothetical protein